jgi:hypothetical protein
MDVTVVTGHFTTGKATENGSSKTGRRRSGPMAGRQGPIGCHAKNNHIRGIPRK